MGRWEEDGIALSSCGWVLGSTCVSVAQMSNAFKASFKLSEAGLELSWERAYLASMEPRVWSTTPVIPTLKRWDRSIRNLESSSTIQSARPA